MSNRLRVIDVKAGDYFVHARVVMGEVLVHVISMYIRPGKDSNNTKGKIAADIQKYLLSIKRKDSDMLILSGDFNLTKVEADTIIPRDFGISHVRGATFRHRPKNGRVAEMAEIDHIYSNA